MTATVEDDVLLSRLETVAADALYKAQRAWKFIHGIDFPDNLERSVRAHVMGGADATMIVGAITIAAQKDGLELEAQWRYANGIIRSSLQRRDDQDVAVAEVMATPPPARSWRERFRLDR